MAVAREATLSPTRNPDGTMSRTFVVYKAADDEVAIGAAAAVAEPIYRGRERADEPACKPIGFDIWEVIYEYTPPESGEWEDPEPPDPPSGNNDDLQAVLEFDTTGGTAHITQCLEQTDYGAESGLQVKNARVIGASGDSVEGTDVVVPKLTLTLSRRPPFMNGNYILKLASLTGKMSSTAYVIRGKVLGVYCELVFAGGELMFLGASPVGESLVRPSPGGTIDGKIQYKFEASANRTNINLGDGLDGAITVASKKGFEYLWTMYQKKELTTPKVAIPVPHIAFVAKLPPGDASFITELGF